MATTPRWPSTKAATRFSPGRATRALSDPAAWNPDARGPQLALDPTGRTVFIWGSFDGTHPDYPKCCTLIQARARSAAGVLSAIYTLSPQGRQAANQDIAMDPN